MKSILLVLSGCLMLVLSSCTSDPPIVVPLNSVNPVLAPSLKSSAQEFSAKVILRNSLDPEVLPVPVTIYLFDLAEVDVAGSYDRETQSMASMVGTEWSKILSPGNYRFEVFEESIDLAMGEFNCMPSHVDVSLTDLNPNQVVELFVEGWVD